ncbi:ribosome silencing factor [Niveispirillum sp.]|uniref:ribosome silencing factor n=1 Tax=Niveispirillum sp. TaxID=1917217 RepID=UPI0025FF155B|nr:ribosome silencing factor [Niveispirillum sp.]
MNQIVSAENSPNPAAAAIAATDMPERTLELILAVLDEDKAEDTITIDLRGKTSMADYLVITTGRSARQVGAMSDHVVRRLRDLGVHAGNPEGYPQCDWVLVDTGDVIVHLFRPEVRAFYCIEKMWGMEPPASLKSLTADFDGGPLP